MTGMRPSELREKNQDRIMAKLYGNNLHRPVKPSVVGKIARIIKIKGLFEKPICQTGVKSICTLNHGIQKGSRY